MPDSREGTDVDGSRAQQGDSSQWGSWRWAFNNSQFSPTSYWMPPVCQALYSVLFTEVNNRHPCPESSRSPGWGGEAFVQSFFQSKNGSSVEALHSSPAPTGPEPQTLIIGKESFISGHSIAHFYPPSVCTSERKSRSRQAQHILAVLVLKHWGQGAASSVEEMRPHCWNYSKASTVSCPSGCSVQVGQRVYLYDSFKA